ncbi:hypothetical protein [Microbacterium helvum]
MLVAAGWTVDQVSVAELERRYDRPLVTGDRTDSAPEQRGGFVTAVRR